MGTEIFWIAPNSSRVSYCRTIIIALDKCSDNFFKQVVEYSTTLYEYYIFPSLYEFISSMILFPHLLSLKSAELNNMFILHLFLITNIPEWI